MIFDFKTDRPAPECAEKAPEAYVVQLALYREVLRKIFPNRPVTCALLWTEAPRLMQLPDARLDAALAALQHG
jgi:ATP-dependent helicase/nuclease subunit A